MRRVLVGVRPAAIHYLDARLIPSSVSVKLTKIRSWARSLPRGQIDRDSSAWLRLFCDPAVPRVPAAWYEWRV